MSQQNSNSAFALYLYVVVITVISGALLSVIYNSLKPFHTANKEVARKQAILQSIPALKTIPTAEVEATFSSRIEVLAVRADGTLLKDASELAGAGREAIAGVCKSFEAVDLALEDKVAVENRVYPVYKYKSDDGKAVYVVAVRGNGLWDKIWGYVSLDADLNTVLGVNFDHKGETPGLGAEIKDSEAFKAAFAGKKIFREGQYVSVAVKKKGIRYPENEVQAIAGATVTSDGVNEMLQRGIGNYTAYFTTLKK